MTGLNLYCFPDQLSDPEDIARFRTRVTTMLNADHYCGWEFSKGQRRFIVIDVDGISEAQAAAADWFKNFNGTDYFNDRGELQMAVRLGRKSWLTEYITVH